MHWSNMTKMNVQHFSKACFLNLYLSLTDKKIGFKLTKYRKEHSKTKWGLRQKLLLYKCSLLFSTKYQGMLLKDVISCNLLNCYFLDFENYVDNILNIFVPTVPGLKRKISFSKSCNQSKECRNVQSCNSICKNLVVYPKSFPSFWFVWLFVYDVYFQLFLLFTFVYLLT